MPAGSIDRIMATPVKYLPGELEKIEKEYLDHRRDVEQKMREMFSRFP